MSYRKVHAALVAAVVAFLSALAWAVVMPPAQGPDEEEHFAYVQFLVEAQRVPTFEKDFFISKEWDEALRANGFDRIHFHPEEKMTAKNWPPADPIGARTPSTRRPVSSASTQSPLYYGIAALCYLPFRNASVIARMYAVRAPSVIFAALTAAFATLLFARLFGADAPITKIGGWVVALHPQASFLFGVINPDGLTTCLMTATFLSAALAWRDRRAMIWLGVGVIAGLTYLSKQFGLSALLTIGFLLLARKRFRASIMLTCGAALTILPWTISNWMRYGGLSGHALHVPSGAEAFLDILRVTTPWTIFSQAWGVFGWLDAPLPKFARAAIAIFCVVAGLRAWRRSRHESSGAIASMAIAAVLHTALVIGAVYGTYKSSGYLVALQGRYFLHPLAAWCGLLAAGLPGIETHRGRAAWRIGLVLLMAYCLLGIVIPRYY